MKNLIEIDNLTKDYGDNRGVFDLSLNVSEGETFGYVGTNGSGKTTTIRHVMGFLKPQKGRVSVFGKDAWTCSSFVKANLGYVPGEIAFPSAKSGLDFLNMQAEILGGVDKNRMYSLIDKLQLDTDANLKRMSKGMKQKTAIVAAFMTDAPLLILDEPTTGLDPLMRKTFLSLLKEEKHKGKTVFMSSQLFDEVDAVCDRVALIKDGRIVSSDSLTHIKRNGVSTFVFTFADEQDAADFAHENGTKNDGVSVRVDVPEGEFDKLTANAKNKKIISVEQIKYDFESYFNAAFGVKDMK